MGVGQQMSALEVIQGLLINGTGQPGSGVIVSNPNEDLLVDENRDEGSAMSTDEISLRVPSATIAATMIEATNYVFVMAGSSHHDFCYIEIRISAVKYGYGNSYA